MGWINRMNRLDEKVGADKVGRGLYVGLGLWMKVWLLIVIGLGIKADMDGKPQWGPLGFFIGVGLLLAILFDPRVGRWYDAARARRRANRSRK
jgi:hypothetical protein